MMVVRARGVARGAALALACLLALVACTSDDELDADSTERGAAPAGDEEDESRPPAGLRVAVLLPSDEAADEASLAQMASDVRRVDAVSGPEVAEVRPLRASSPSLVDDLGWTLAERDTDLICLLGYGTRSLVTDLAEHYPNLRFCAAPMSTTVEVPEPIQVLELRSAELGMVVGVAAAEAAENATIGVVLGARTQPRGAFRDGILAATDGFEVVQVTVDEELDALAAVDHVLDEGAEVVVIDSVEGAAEALDRAAEHALVLSPEVFVQGPIAERSVLSWRLHWDVPLQHALDALTGEVDATPTSFGFDEGAFTLSGGESAPPGMMLRLQEAVTELEAGNVDPEDPPADLLPPIPEPEDDEGDDLEEDDEDDDG